MSLIDITQNCSQKTNILNIYSLQIWQEQFSGFCVLIGPVKAFTRSIFLKLSGGISQILGPKTKHFLWWRFKLKKMP